MASLRDVGFVVLMLSALVCGQDAPIRVLSVPVPGLLDASATGGKPLGFIPDLLDAITTKTGLTFQYLPLGTDFGRQLPDKSFNGIVGQLLNRDGDLIAAAMENHPSYQENMALTAPLYMSNVHVVAPNTSKAVTELIKVLSLMSPATAQFASKYIPYTVILENTATRDYLEEQALVGAATTLASSIWKNVSTSMIQSMVPKTYTQAMSCVKKFLCKFVGRTPAIDNDVAASAGKIMKDPKIIRTVSASFAVRKESTDLLNKLNGAISSLQASGDIERIYQGHFKTSLFVKP